MGDHNVFGACWLSALARAALELVKKQYQRFVITNYVSQILEFAVAQHYYRKTGELIFLPVGYCKEFDGISRSRQLIFETKFEKKAVETGNLAFEFSCRGKPSGLAATEATKWVHMVPIDQSELSCFEFDVDRLRTALLHLPLHRGGDRNQSMMKLLRVADAEKLATDKFTLSIPWGEIKPYW
jgi:hypothetical protein